MSESSAYKTIRWVEEVLISGKEFSLPGRKALLKSDREYEVVLMQPNRLLKGLKKTKILLFGKEETAYSKDASVG